LLEKAVLCTKEIILENTVRSWMLCQYLKCSKKKIQVLQANKIGLWDVLKIETRKFRHSYQNQKENDFESLFRLFPNIKTIVFNGKESHKYFCKKFGNRRHHLSCDH
jgi:G:T/U-mismatch repair DNA glycosylase